MGTLLWGPWSRPSTPGREDRFPVVQGSGQQIPSPFGGVHGESLFLRECADRHSLCRARGGSLRARGVAAGLSRRAQSETRRSGDRISGEASVWPVSSPR